VVITQIQPISVIFTLPKNDLPAIATNMRSETLKVETFDQEMTRKVNQGTLSTLDNQIDPTTGTVKLHATFDNREGSLFANQFVNARLLVQEKQGVTLIPTAAVQRNSQVTYVYLVVPNTSQKPDTTITIHNINIGTTENEDTEVTSGL